MEGARRTNPSEVSRAVFLKSSSNIYDGELASKKRLYGWLVVRARDAVRRLLAPSLSRQNTYNEVNAEFALQMLHHVTELRGEDERIEARIEASARHVRDELLTAIAVAARTLREAGDEKQHAVEERLSAELRRLGDLVRDEIARVDDAMAHSRAGSREHVAAVERRVRRLQHALTPDDVGPTLAGTEGRADEPQLIDLEFDYAGFEERFRGSEDDIRERQAQYVDLFRQAEPVIDIACGRGEFLELLDSMGVGATGVDLDLDMVLLCKEKGLDVVQEDAFAYLARLPDSSAGGMFSAQFVEHLPGPEVVRLIRLMYAKLRPGGVLAVETVNPGCLATFATSFYADLTHINPIHPEALRFVAESIGFTDVEVRYSAPIDASMRVPTLCGDDPGVAAFNDGIRRLNDLVYGYQDYAIVAHRPRHG